MTNWGRVLADDFAVPAGRPPADLVAELSEMLCSPSPEVRDRQAYSTLATWIGRGILTDAELRALGNELVGRFGAPQVQARTFAPLVLDSIVSAGVLDPAWIGPFERWYIGEQDLRGYDEELGWLHAVAHGADLLGALGLAPEVEPRRMLDLGIERLLAPTQHVFRDLEDDRLGAALAATLTRTDLTAADAVAWLDPTGSGPRLDGRGVRPEVSNTLRTMRVVYWQVDRGVRLSGVDDPVPVPHRAAVKDRLVAASRALMTW